jgi:DNA-binding CsgD family transcriptional regulator
MLPLLTVRQLECLAWVQAGKSANDIGSILGVSGRTVEGHLARVCELLGVRTRIQAVLRARELGILPCVRDPRQSMTWLGTGDAGEGALLRR